MRTLLFACLLFATPVLAQDPAYGLYVHQADSLFRLGEFRASATTFSQAFEVLGWRGVSDDRFTAARAWSRAGVPDSAIYQLQRLLDKTDFLDTKKDWMLEPDFAVIQNSFGWQRLMTQWNMKQEKMEKIRSNPLSIELEQIHFLDQYYRVKRDSVLEFHSLKSPEMQDWMRRWNLQDSLNYVRVNEILEQHGWLGPDEVTEYASRAFWLVLQHADRNLPGQEKWLPVMREAVQQGKAKAQDLAYLEDRVLKNQGKPQRYGSQMHTDPVTKEFLLYPVEDPANLDARRKSVGLGPIQHYLEQMGGAWKQ
ncbi:MAG: DUF6624 domain-containing protein [Saprospiraceae bacterium]